MAGASLAAVDAQALTLARPDRVASPQAVGILYDSALCVGCKACVAACKAANGAPAVVPATLADWNQGVWDSAEDLDGRTLNVIKAYVNGTREVKDREVDGFASGVPGLRQNPANWALSTKNWEISHRAGMRGGAGSGVRTGLIADFPCFPGNNRENLQECK